MKKSLFSLPVCAALVAGCGTSTVSATNDIATPAQTPLAEKLETPKTDAPAQPAESAAPAAPTKGYSVVDLGQPGMPPTMAAALKSLKKYPPPPASLKVPKNARVQLQTSKGKITVELATEEAPLHAKSFYYLTQKEFFNNTTFHRWADLLEGSPEGKAGAIIQGGDPLTGSAKTTEFAGVGGPGYQIVREQNKLTHKELMLAAARSSDPDSAGSQFYITQNPVPFLDQGDGYTVFGRVVEGKDAALKLRQGDKIIKAVILK